MHTQDRRRLDRQRDQQLQPRFGEQQDQAVLPGREGPGLARRARRRRDAPDRPGGDAVPELAGGDMAARRQRRQGGQARARAQAAMRGDAGPRVERGAVAERDRADDDMAPVELDQPDQRILADRDVVADVEQVPAAAAQGRRRDGCGRACRCGRRARAARSAGRPCPRSRATAPAAPTAGRSSCADRTCPRPARGSAGSGRSGAASRRPRTAPPAAHRPRTPRGSATARAG